MKIPNRLYSQWLIEKLSLAERLQENPYYVEAKLHKGRTTRNYVHYIGGRKPSPRFSASLIVVLSEGAINYVVETKNVSDMGLCSVRRKCSPSVLSFTWSLVDRRVAQLSRKNREVV